MRRVNVFDLFSVFLLFFIMFLMVNLYYLTGTVPLLLTFEPLLVISYVLELAFPDIVAYTAACLLISGLLSLFKIMKNAGYAKKLCSHLRITCLCVILSFVLPIGQGIYHVQISTWSQM